MGRRPRVCCGLVCASVLAFIAGRGAARERPVNHVVETVHAVCAGVSSPPALKRLQGGPSHSTGRALDSSAAVEITIAANDSPDRIAQIMSAPKRKPGDRVYVAMYPPTGRPADLVAAYRVSDILRDELIASGSISVLADEDLQMARRIRRANVRAGLDPGRAPAADVEIRLRIQTESPGPTRLEATIESNFLPAEYRVTEDVSTADPRAAQRFAARIRRVIVDTIGPTLPTDRNI